MPMAFFKTTVIIHQFNTKATMKWYVGTVVFVLLNDQLSFSTPTFFLPDKLLLSDVEYKHPVEGTCFFLFLQSCL